MKNSDANYDGPPYGFFLTGEDIPVRRQSEMHWPERLQAGKWVVWTDLWRFGWDCTQCTEEEFRQAVKEHGGDPDEGLD